MLGASWGRTNFVYTTQLGVTRLAPGGRAMGIVRQRRMEFRARTLACASEGTLVRGGKRESGTERCARRRMPILESPGGEATAGHPRSGLRAANAALSFQTILNEFYMVAFRKKLYGSIDELQRDLDNWLKQYNEARPHQGRWCYGKTPMATFLESLPLGRQKMLGTKPAVTGKASAAQVAS